VNPALIVTHNNLDLTKQCVESLRNQDIPVDILVVDNGSTDDTLDWCAEEGLQFISLGENTGFSRGMNVGLGMMFDTGRADYCLCPGSDTILPPFYYRSLLELNLPVVSGVQDIEGHRVTLEDLTKAFPVQPVRPNPDFSCLLWRKEPWLALGGLDEAMVSYASDCDMHLRAHRAGIGMFHAPHIPFFHYGSSTIKNAPPKEKRTLEMQADADRLAFAEKWGFEVGSPKYADAFDPKFFGNYILNSPGAK
jgi:GT2 family glycosyltransferase